MGIKEDIVQKFLKDLETHNKIFDKVKESNRIFNAINKTENIPDEKLKELYEDFKINITKTFLYKLEEYVNGLEDRYALLNDALSVIDKNKRIIEEEIELNKGITYDDTIKKCDDVFNELNTEFERLKNNERQLIRDGFWKFLGVYATLYGILSGAIGFLI